MAAVVEFDDLLCFQGRLCYLSFQPPFMFHRVSFHIPATSLTKEMPCPQMPHRPGFLCFQNCESPQHWAPKVPPLSHLLTLRISSLISLRLPARFLCFDIYHLSHPWFDCFRRSPICSFTFFRSNNWYVSFLYSVPLIAFLTHTTFRLPPSPCV